MKYLEFCLTRVAALKTTLIHATIVFVKLGREKPSNCLNDIPKLLDVAHLLYCLLMLHVCGFPAAPGVM